MHSARACSSVVYVCICLFAVLYDTYDKEAYTLCLTIEMLNISTALLLFSTSVENQIICTNTCMFTLFACRGRQGQ